MSPGPNYEGLTVRKVADTTDGERVVGYDPATDTKFLADPETGEPKPWPLVGWIIVGDVPRFTKVSTKQVQLWASEPRSQGSDEKFLSYENLRVVHRPGGPVVDPWRVTHTLPQCDAIVLHTLDGDVRYEVFGKRGQPDKYDKDGNPTDKTGDPELEVEWFYNLRLADGNG